MDLTIKNRVRAGGHDTPGKWMLFLALFPLLFVLPFTAPAAVPAGTIVTVAGNGAQDYTGDGGPATAAKLDDPIFVAADLSGNLFIADTYNNCIRKIDASTGIIMRVAGDGVSVTGDTGYYSGDGGLAVAAGLYNPFGLAIDAAGNLFIADTFNNRVRKVAAGTGIITTVAGTGTAVYSGDGGPATDAGIYHPVGIAIDSMGNLFFTDAGNNCIRKISAGTGIITTVAGDGTYNFSGDGGAATSAELAWPMGIMFDSSANIYFADTSNYRIRKVDAGTGIITTVAGNGSIAYSGEGGAATAAGFSQPTNIAFDALGNLFIADLGNNRIYKVTVGTGVITTVAGNGTGGYTGDGGLATAAEILDPRGVAFDASGNLYIADMGNSCVRKIYAVGSFPTPTPNYGVSTLGKAVWGPVPAKAGDPVNLYFDKAPASSSCQVYNLAGDKVLSASFDGPSASLQTGHLAPGIYAVRAVVNYQDGSTQTMFQKIVITK